MSQASALSSLQITSLNGTPPVSYTRGEGAPGNTVSLQGFVTALSGDTTASVYKMVRIPSNAKVKKVTLNSTVAGAGAGNIGVAYSNSTADMTAVANQGAVISASLFGAAETLVGTGQSIDVTFLGTYTFANINTPLWSVLGLSQDPGGMFDIEIAVSTAITTGGVVGIEVSYVE